MDAIGEIYKAINPMPSLLSAKGKSQPKAQLIIEANAQFSLHLNWVKGGSTRDWERHYECFMGNSADEAIDKGIAFIGKLPDAEVAKLHDFMGQLGKVIDSGRELGIAVDYLNPLTDTMKRLSENVITYQPNEASS